MMISLGRGLRISDVLVVPPSPPSPEAKAFAIGAMLQREYGNDWPRLIGIAAQAAMNADHEVTE